EQAEKILQAEPATRGNNFLIAVPSTDATSVAAVFEYDARMQLTKGLTVRGALVADQSSEANFIACTNHYRSRENPGESCWRYRKIMATLNDGGEPIDSKTAWKIMASVAVNNTIHSMVAFPNQKEFELKLATPGDQACHQQAKRFSLATLLK
ncbi:MAG: hypothetical protein GXP29_01140, partial [Planctomycetes bacterium]|nr:hypothetical protein [Planctomycetota bacterium]